MQGFRFGAKFNLLFILGQKGFYVVIWICN